MTIISLIAAADNNFCIGKNNTLAWHISEDLKFFRSKVDGKTIIMGRKTYDSMPPSYKNRPNTVVISRSAQQSEFPHEIVLAGSIQDAFHKARDMSDDSELFVIGGGQIYTAALPFADRIYLTHVDTNVENGDAFFPLLGDEWHDVSDTKWQTDEKSGLRYRFATYEKT